MNPYKYKYTDEPAEKDKTNLFLLVLGSILEFLIASSLGAFFLWCLSEFRSIKPINWKLYIKVSTCFSIPTILLIVWINLYSSKKIRDEEPL